MHAAEQTVHWTVEHQSKLIVAGVVVAIVIAAIIGGWYYNERQDEKASAEFGKALQTLDMPVRPAGMPPQPDTPSFASSKNAPLKLTNSFRNLSINIRIPMLPTSRAIFWASLLPNLAIIPPPSVSSKQSPDYHNRDLSALAKLALAGVYRDTNRTSDAVNLYKQLMEKPSHTVSKSAAEFQLAETYQGAGMTADAKKQYEQIQKEAPAQSEANQLASAKLQELK